MRKTIILSGLMSACILLAACTNYNEEELYGPTEEICTITTVTFSADIKPIMQRACTSCHNASFFSGNIILDTYAGVKNAAVDQGKLLPAINHESGYIPMPLGGNKLPPCDIAKIKKWLDLGALNN